MVLNNKWERERERSERETLKKKLVSSLIRIHVTFFKHCIYLFIIMATRDLLYVLDRLLHVTWNRNPSPSITHPCNPISIFMCVYVYV